MKLYSIIPYVTSLSLSFAGLLNFHTSNLCESFPSLELDRSIVLIANRTSNGPGCTSQSDIEGCPHIVLHPGGAAQIFLRLYPTPLVEHPGKYEIISPTSLAVEFKYENPEFNGCFGSCFHVKSDLSKAAHFRCDRECSEVFLEQYGKTEVAFPVRILLEQTESGFSIVSIVGEDPSPIPNKKVLQFTEAFHNPVGCIIPSNGA